MIYPVRHPRWSVLSALLVFGFTGAVAAATAVDAAPRRQGPDFSGRVSPCCEGPFAEAPGEPSAAPWDQPRPRHYVFDRATVKRLKSRAVFDPAAPQGVDLGADEPSAVSPLLRSLTPNLNTRFLGMDIVTETSVGLVVPPDTILAAGPNKILEATNAGLWLAGRNGLRPKVTSLNDFFGQKRSAFLFDPKVYFDRLSERFFVIAVSRSESPRQSFLFLGVSRGSDPQGYGPGDWCRYRFNTFRDGAWADFPGLGMNENWVAVSFNAFRFVDDRFANPFIYALSKAALVRNAQSCPAVSFTGYRPIADAEGTIAFTIQPAQHYTTNSLSGTPIFFVSNQPLLSSNSYALWRLQGSPPGRPELSKVNISGDFNYQVQPNAPQRGGDELDTGDNRVMQAAFRNGRIWAVHATACNIGLPPTESCIRVIEIEPTDLGGTITFQETFGIADWFAWWPGVAVNASGDVAVAFQRSRADRFLDTAYNGKRAGAATFDSIRTFKLGECTLFNDPDNNGVNRTGDYVGVQTDPLDNRSFWIAGEFTGPVRVLGCNWKTMIGRVSYPVQPGPAGPRPAQAGVARESTAGSAGDEPAAAGEPGRHRTRVRESRPWEK